MSGPGDVLDALHDCAERLRTKGCFAFAAELDAARAAVAELIEATGEIHAAIEANADPTAVEDVLWEMEMLEQHVTLDAGLVRQLISALARCRGEA